MHFSLENISASATLPYQGENLQSLNSSQRQTSGGDFVILSESQLQQVRENMQNGRARFSTDHDLSGRIDYLENQRSELRHFYQIKKEALHTSQLKQVNTSAELQQAQIELNKSELKNKNLLDKIDDLVTSKRKLGDQSSVLQSENKRLRLEVETSREILNITQAQLESARNEIQLGNRAKKVNRGLNRRLASAKEIHTRDLLTIERQNQLIANLQRQLQEVTEGKQSAEGESLSAVGTENRDSPSRFTPTLSSESN